ncbi:MAG: hypothetical protein ACYTGN_02590 [Planctomycetota bacterium]|jgi:hypothetical protein
MSRLPFVLVILIAATAVGQEKKPKKSNAVKDTAKAINAALGKNDATAASAAFETAKKLSEEVEARKFEPVVKAVGKAVGHRDEKIATAAIGTLAAMRRPGSSKYLAKPLKVPAKPNATQLALCKAALVAAAELHEPAQLKTLEKMVTHANAEVGAASATAIAGYKSLDLKPLLALMDRLVPTLARLEKAAAAGKDETKAKANAVKAALNATLQTLSNGATATTSKEWENWIKDAKKRAKKEKKSS